MLAEPPLPLPPEYPLEQLVRLTDPGAARRTVGVWLDVERTTPICIAARGRCCRILLSNDLGLLLSRCSHVAVRQGAQVQVLAADLLTSCRTLEVVMPAGCSPDPARPQQIFPGAVLHPKGFRIPLDSVPPETVLAECFTHGIPVAESRIGYSGRGRVGG